MVDTYSGTVPNLTQAQPDFDTNTQAILDYITSLAPQLNEWVGAYVQDTTTISSTEHTLGTGSKVFTVEAGKGYKEDMTVRASAGGGNFMDGNVTAYSGNTLTVNFTNYNGSGTFDDWDIYLNISGGATLESNTFTGDQFVPDEAYDATGWNGDLSVPTKNAVRDKIESILSAVKNATNDSSFSSTSSTDTTSPEWVKGLLSSYGIGVGQTWQSVTGSRSSGVTYTNSTGKPIMVVITLNSGSGTMTPTVQGVALGSITANNSGGSSSFIVPNGATYSVSGTFSNWAELR